jgi:hypothetical protein
MHKIRIGLIGMCILLCSATSAPAQVSIGIGLPNVSIGINLPLYPELVPVSGYPVYYAPSVHANYFFYDGMFWVFQYNNWYVSSWYNGPWAFVDPVIVPVFILRIPVRYYRLPPVYFRGWRPNAPPHWGERWGHSWKQHRRGWDSWNRSHAPARAPLPVYQRRYSGDRYPRVEQQQTIRSRHYRYQPHNTIIRQHYRGQRAPVPVQPGRREAPQTTSPRQHEIQRSTPPRQGGQAGPRTQPTPRGGKDFQRSAPVQPPQQQQSPAFQGQRQHPGAEQRKQQAPRYQGQEQRSQEPERGHGQGQKKGEERGRGHNN